MERFYNKVVRTVRRLPYGERAIAETRKRLPAPAKRLLRRTRHRILMRSPRSLLSRVVTPGVQNRLLGDPHVVQRLLETERAAEILNHRPPSAEHGIDWVSQVALNDPAGVVGALEMLAAKYPHVDAAVDRLAAGRPAVLSEEQVVDVFLSLAEFEQRQYWTNPRVKEAFLDYLCRDSNLAETRLQLVDRLDHLNLIEARSRVRVLNGDGESDEPVTHAIESFVGSVDPPVAADILLSLDMSEMSNLWAIESFRTSFVENLLGDEDLFRLRSLLRYDRFEDPEVRQSLFDALAGGQRYQIMTSVDETLVLPSADLGFSKAFWADRSGELSHLERFLAARPRTKPARTCFVDIGANIATHTIRALGSGSFTSAVLVEPDPRLLPILKANIALNKLDKCVTIAECAAGEKQGEVSLWCSEVNWGDNRLTGSPADGWYEVKVPVKPLDEILRVAGVKSSDVGALWIDVQGHESEVLEGARELIEAGCDLVVEFWPTVLAKEGRLESTIESLLSISERWLNLDDGEFVGRARLEEMQEIGIETGEAYFADLALVHGITELNL
jgi:FkbM family methyltransferase